MKKQVVIEKQPIWAFSILQTHICSTMLFVYAFQQA